MILIIVWKVSKYGIISGPQLDIFHAVYKSRTVQPCFNQHDRLLTGLFKRIIFWSLEQQIPAVTYGYKKPLVFGKTWVLCVLT